VVNCGLKWVEVERRNETGVLDLIIRIELMFLGEFYHNLDEKGRLTLPALFRKMLAEDDGAYLLRGFDRNLMLLTSASFSIIYERVNHMSMTDPTARLLRRLIFSGAAPVEFDKAGRILLPPFLREGAEIQNEAVIVGAGDYVEIWSPKLWAAQRELLNDVNVTADRFAALDLASS
jgi:MraZ protein